MSEESLNDCIETGECRATLFKQTGCSHCENMKEKLDNLGIEYDEEEIDEIVLQQFHRRTVPFLRVEKDFEDDIILENEDEETLKEKLSRLRV